VSRVRQILDEYELDRVLKTTLRTTVFLASDRSSGHRVVIKLINPPGPVAEEANRSMFLQTAQVAQTGVIRALPRTLDYGFTPEHNAYLVTEWLDALTPLSDLGGTPTSKVVSLLVAVLDAVDAFAMSGMCHLNLSPENVLIAESTVRLTGFGTAAYLVGSASRVWPTEDDRYAAPELAGSAVLGRDDLWLADMYSFTLMACDLLGAQVGDLESDHPSVRFPGGAKGSQKFADAATVALRGDPRSRDVTVSDLRKSLVKGVFDTPAGGALPPTPEAGRTQAIDLRAPQASETGSGTVLAPKERHQPVPEIAPQAPPPPAAAASEQGSSPEDHEVTTPSPSEPAGGRKPPWLLVIVAAAAAMLAVVVVVSVVILWTSGRRAAPVPEPTAVPATPTRVPTPVPEVEAEPQVNPKLEEAARLLGEGDEDAARQLLESITDEETELFSPREMEIYEVVDGTLRGSDLSSAVKDLRGGLSAGSIRMLRRGVAALGGLPNEEIQAEEGLRDDLDHARTVLQVHQKLWDAKRSGDHVSVLEQARRMISLLPGYSGAPTLRNEAAEAIEADAEAAIARRDFNAALAELEKIHSSWPERQGLVERMEYCRDQQATDRRMTATLEQAVAAGAAGDPERGLEILAATRPSPEFKERFASAKRRLEGMIVDLDVEPPRIEIPSDLKLVYKKNETFVVPVSVSDDYGVELVAVYVKVGTETGYREIELKPEEDGEYRFRITPDLHQNTKVFFYLEATDGSGHTTSLGSVTDPFILSKKGLFRH